jgi:adenylosuccinate synthase
VHEEHDGWKQDLSGVTAASQLPAKARAYLARVSELAGARISLIGIVPSREQTLVL